MVGSKSHKNNTDSDIVVVAFYQRGKRKGCLCSASICYSKWGEMWINSRSSNKGSRVLQKKGKFLNGCVRSSIPVNAARTLERFM